MPVAVHTTAVVNALIFDGRSPDLIEGAVHMAGGVIVAVGDAPAEPADVIVDARGGVVLPGLIDAHFHAYGIGLDLLGIEATPLSYLALKGAQRLGRALHRGFTTVRDVAGGDPGLANAVEEGVVPAPRYLFTGPALSQTGGHGDPRPGDSHLCACGSHLAEIVDGVDDLRRAVRDRFRQGAHAIKIMTSGGVVSLTDPIRIPQYSPEEVRAVTDEATRRGSYVAAHAYSPEAIVHSIDNGVRTIEHGNLLDAATAERMAELGAFLVPTLAAYDAMDRRGPAMGMARVSIEKNREVLDAGRVAVDLAGAAGVQIGFGTDLMGDLEDDQLHGLRLQVEVQGPLDALRSATSTNAALLGRPDLGVVEVGAAADLLVLDANPLEDPTVLWGGPQHRTVIAAGAVI